MFICPTVGWGSFISFLIILSPLGKIWIWTCCFWSKWTVCADQPAYVHGGHSLPGVGLGVKPLHRVQAAGAIIASCNIEHAVQHCHTGAAAPTQHVGNGYPCVALFIETTLVRRSHKFIHNVTQCKDSYSRFSLLHSGYSEDQLNSIEFTWGSYFSTVARCEELS